MSAMEISIIIRLLEQGCSPDISNNLHARFRQIISETGTLPDMSDNLWVKIVYKCFCSNLVEIGTTIATLLIQRGVHVEQLTKSLELARQGELIKAAYVARGHAAYNELFTEGEGALHSIPPIVLTEVAAMPATAQALDLGCGTGLIGEACRSIGYTGHFVGLDLVDDMVAAIPSGIYDSLVVADAFTWMADSDQKWDVVLSFGVFVHFDQDAAAKMISLVADSLKTDGLFAFNAAEQKETFVHALPASVAGPLIEQSGLEFEAMVRRETRTTFVCRKP